MPPAENPTADDLPPLPPSGGRKPAGKKSKKPEGMSPGVKIFLIIFSVISGITILGCGGCYLAAYMGLKTIDKGLTDAAKQIEKDAKEQEERAKAEGGKSTAGETNNATGSTPSSSPTPPPSSSETQFAEKDMETAEGKQRWQGFKGKTVELTGIVTNVDHDIMVTLGKKSVCVLDRKDVPSWRKLLPGQTATIRGIANDPIIATMMGSTIVKVEGKPGPEYSVEEVERILSSDTDTKKKNAIRTLTGGDEEARIIIRGKIEKLFGGGFVDFINSKKAKINFHVQDEVDENDKADLARCKVGDTIRAVGRLNVTPNALGGPPMATLSPAHIIFDK